MLPDAVAAIAEQLELITPDQDEVQEACDRIHDAVSHRLTPSDIKLLLKLARLLRGADGQAAGPVVDLFAGVLLRLDQPWPFLTPLLGATDESLATRGIDLTLTLIEKGRLAMDRRVLHSFAHLLEQPEGTLANHDLQYRLRAAINNRYQPSGIAQGAGLDQLFLRDRDPGLRRLASVLLDLDSAPVSNETAARVLGKRAFASLAPYLAYTRATHSDLIALTGGGRINPKVVAAFNQATRDHGEALVRTAIATLGWARVNQGLQVEAFVELTWPGNFPLLVHPEEAVLFTTDPPPATGGLLHLVVAKGGAAPGTDKRMVRDNPIDKFRVMNIAHAELLGEILEVVPPDQAKIRRIISLMDAVVAAFNSLFSDLAEEYRILPAVWNGLRDPALAQLAEHPPAGTISAALTRLVLAFEDPANLGEVRTIHGLKRYLHQQGLKRGFSLVDTGQSPSLTVDLLLLRGIGPPIHGPRIHFAELEPGIEPDPDPWLPQPVRLAADGLAWQLLRGVTAFPHLDVFIFGNEVHYYIAFRNHPAFLRVDFSPPQRGGMLDLEYYGVSNYETDIHPNIKLDAIRLFYRAMELDVRIEGTRLFVRYDKERCPSLDDLVDKAAALFRFAPFLMDIDWIAGSLQFPQPIRTAIVQAWAERFRRSGIFPAEAILTKNRRQILVDRSQGPAGEKEEVWSGKGVYHDRFQGPAPANFWENCGRELECLGLPLPQFQDQPYLCPLALLDIQAEILDPVRRMVASGQLVVRAGVLQPASAKLFAAEHETERFAALLTGNHTATAEAITAAGPLSYLEKFITFEPTGYVGGLRVERGRLPLRGGTLLLYVGRDEHSVIRLGMYTPQDGLFMCRANPSQPWRSNAMVAGERLWALMRSANYVGDAPGSGSEDVAATLTLLQKLATRPIPGGGAGLAGEDNVLTGLAASPGRAVGRAVFGTAGRQPQDLAGAILVAREVRPTDTPFLFRSAGVISTGGAVLSHAALLAIQFGKPAMLVAGLWDSNRAAPALHFQVTRYSSSESESHGLRVCRRAAVARELRQMVEGDLLVLDAGEQLVRVLGQEADTTVLWSGLQLLARANAAREAAVVPREIMEIRAQMLRARHQIRKAISKLKRPAIALFALEEIVVGEDLAGLKTTDREEILGDLLASPTVATEMGLKLRDITAGLADRYANAAAAFGRNTPTARHMFEVLGMRLRVLRRRDALQVARDLQPGCGPTEEPPSDGPAISRLAELGRQLKSQLKHSGPETRHLLRRIERLDRMLPGHHLLDKTSQVAAKKLAVADRTALTRAAESLVLAATEGGLEMHPVLGWKGANLAEMDRLAGMHTVPPWFAVTDTAFRQMLDQQVRGGSVVKEHLGAGPHTLKEAIDGVLRLPRMDHASQAELIRKLWIEAPLPEDLVDAVTRACADLQGTAAEEIFVALRSSSCDEDSETAMRAGLYDTFLFVRGITSVLMHLKLGWSGLWTERALFSRASDGDLCKQPAGGIIVQRMVRSRVSGVLQTVNVAGRNLGELVISAGLGLGEGIVSGQAAADLITVVKDQGPDQDPVHVNYLTNDKPQQVVFDQRRGRGTCLTETLYHQRLRPALEFSELCEVTRKALTLEAAYGYPLDIEFALEDDRLWLLQARPIASIQAEYQITLDRYPLKMQARGE